MEGIFGVVSLPYTLSTWVPLALRGAVVRSRRWSGLLALADRGGCMMTGNGNRLDGLTPWGVRHLATAIIERQSAFCARDDRTRTDAAHRCGADVMARAAGPREPHARTPEGPAHALNPRPRHPAAGPASSLFPFLSGLVGRLAPAGSSRPAARPRPFRPRRRRRPSPRRSPCCSPPGRPRRRHRSSWLATSRQPLALLL